MAIHYAFLAFMWLGALQDTKRWPPGSGLRIVITLLVPTGYILLADFANYRASIIRPSGVGLTLFPFPIETNRTIPRSEITTCYARNCIETTGEGLDVYNDYSVGVETRAGQYFDIEIRYQTEAKAITVAKNVAIVLNTNVLTIPRRYTALNAKRIATLWTVLTIPTVALGAAWDRNLKLF